MVLIIVLHVSVIGLRQYFKTPPQLPWRGACSIGAALQSIDFIRVVHRLDGTAQAQYPPLAPDRRPGMETRDQEYPN